MQRWRQPARWLLAVRVFCVCMRVGKLTPIRGEGGRIEAVQAEVVLLLFLLAAADVPGVTCAGGSANKETSGGYGSHCVRNDGEGEREGERERERERERVSPKRRTNQTLHTPFPIACSCMHVCVCPRVRACVRACGAPSRQEPLAVRSKGRARGEREGEARALSEQLQAVERAHSRQRERNVVPARERDVGKQGSG